MARYLGEPICFRLQTSIVQLCHQCALIRRQRFVLFVSSHRISAQVEAVPKPQLPHGFSVSVAQLVHPVALALAA